MCVNPVRGGIPILLSPEALEELVFDNSQSTTAQERIETYVPGRGSIKGLGGIVETFPVSSNKKYLILNVARTLEVETEDLVGKSLPL
jgi:hypothetical protein